MSVNSATSSNASSSTSATALNAISSNFNDFLNLLTTQLQNQDPSSPMDTSQFTSELAQFAGVQQQVDTNTNLTTLIQLTQGQGTLQGASLLGKAVELSGTTLPLQNSAAALQFTSPLAQNVQITVTDAAGNTVVSQTVAATAGANVWDWNGKTASGGTEPDGAYTVGVASVNAQGTSTPLSFTTAGVVTGVTPNNGVIDLTLGATTLPLSDVVNVSG